MNAPLPPARRGGALRELTLARLRLFFREPGAVFWTFGFPLAMAVALGVAFRNQPAQVVRAAVVSTADSRALLRAPGVQPVPFATEAAARDAQRTNKVDVVVLPGAPVVQYVFDPSRPESRAARLVVDDALQRELGRKDATLTADVPVTEPGSRYIDFLIPGLLGMTIMSGGMWGIGWIIVEMRTRKLLKRLVATPMRRWEFLSSFVVLRALFLLLELPVLLGFGALVFGVPIRGSLPLVILVALLGGFAFGAIGLLVASRAQNSQTASGLINAVMMPMFVGSGVFFSTARFPGWLQLPLRALPLTALNDGLRAVMLEGADARAVAPQLLLLAGITVVAGALALKLFRWR